MTECADDAPTVERIAQVNNAMVTLASEKRQLRIKEHDEKKAKREADKKTAEDAKAEKKRREGDAKVEEKEAKAAAKAAAKPKAKDRSWARVQSEPVV